MKKIILLLTFFTAAFPAQTEQRSIELPDFVITGRQNVEVPIAQKRKPDLIGTLSKDFFIPQFDADDLPLLIASQPKPVKPDITSAGNYFSALLDVAVGMVTLPVGNFHISKSFPHYLIAADVWGSNIKEYIPKAGYNTSGLSLNNDLFISTRSAFLPGSKISLGGLFERDSYKFYGSATPDSKRETNNFGLSFSLENDYSKFVKFGLSFDANQLSLNENDFTERTVKAAGYGSFYIEQFSVGFEVLYRRQTLENNLSRIGNYDFYNVDGFAEFVINRTLTLKAGVSFANNGSNSFFAPFGTAQLVLAKNITLTGEFMPGVQYYTVSDFLKKNLFMMNNLTDNVMTETKFALKSTLRYEFERDFALDLYARFTKADNFIYFEDIVNPGKYDLLMADDVKNISAGLKFILYPSLFGNFTADLKFQSVKDRNDFYIPYEPQLVAELIYGYDFYFGAGINIRFNYAGRRYADLANKKEIEDYQDLSIGGYYKLFDGLRIKLDFQNILDKANFVVDKYQGKPLDILAGIEYRW